MRDLKFKVFNTASKIMTGPFYINQPMGINVNSIILQFVGLLDKNKVEIFEADIVKYYSLERFVQQSHDDINPEIDTMFIRAKTSVVEFKDGSFHIEKEAMDYSFIVTLSHTGLFDIENIKEMCSCVDDETCDINGNEIDESILGIEVIGNIYSNPELLTDKQKQ